MFAYPVIISLIKGICVVKRLTKSFKDMCKCSQSTITMMSMVMIPFYECAADDNKKAKSIQLV